MADDSQKQQIVRRCLKETKRFKRSTQKKSTRDGMLSKLQSVDFSIILISI
jgi:hypothetical protein